MAVTPKIPLEREPKAKSLDPKALVKRQPIQTGRDLRPGSVYDRSRLGPGNVLAGPALIIDPESTTFLPPGFKAAVDPFLNLVIRKAGPR